MKIIYNAIRIHLIVLMFFVLSTCQQNVKSEMGSEKDFQTKINEFVNEGPDFLERNVEKNKEDIINKLGSPLNIMKKEIKNIHDPDVKDTIYELFYNGLYIRIYEAKSVGKEFVNEISITSDQYKTKWGLNVGVTKEYVKSILGNPLKAEGNAWTYIDSEGYKDDPYQDTVKFYFKENIVYKINWDFWID